METYPFYLGTIVLGICLQVRGRALNSHNIKLNIDPEEYLQNYGYMHKTGPSNIGSSSPDIDLSQSLRKFQQWYNLPITGELDTATQKLMSKPRCGVPDFQVLPEMSKEFVLGPKWSKNKLTYRINNFSPDLSSAVIWSELARAFKFWTDVANLEISEGSGNSDITVLFAAGDHGDRAPFDGEGGVLAHATFPESGQCHFDDDETWVANTTGSDLFMIAAHEIGHVLGLDHSNFTSALMYPIYGGYVPNYTIQPDDREAIVAHYGEATTVTTTQPLTTYVEVTTPETSTEITTQQTTDSTNNVTTTTGSSIAAMTVSPNITMIFLVSSFYFVKIFDSALCFLG